MIPVANRPLLEYVVSALAEAGVEEVVLVVGYKRDRIQTYFGDGDDWGIGIEYAVQDKQLGTGHAVLQAEPFVDDEFLVVNGDSIVESALVERMVEAGAREGGAAMAVTRARHPSEYGVVELDGDRVGSITEKPRADESPSEIINAGAYAFAPSVFDALRATDAGDDGELAITATIADMVDDDRVSPVRYRGLWVDVTHLWDVTRVTRDVVDRDGGAVDGTASVDDRAAVSDSVRIGADSRIDANATVRRGASLGDNVTVGPNATVSNAVVLADASVAAGAVVRDAVVAENATVGPNATVPGGRADVVVDGTVHEDVPLGAVLGDNTRIGGGTVVEAGTVVGDDVTVEDGAVLSGRVPPGAEVRRG
jgi:glucose-1-phosphate thymidylyltransferase